FPAVSLLVSGVTAQYCTGYAFSGDQIFPSCADLPYLNSFLHWDLNQSSNSVKIAYRVTGDSTGKWVAWAVNPTGRGMVGAQSLVAYRQSNGAVRAYTSPVSDYRTALQEGELSFAVANLTASFTASEAIIFAKLELGNLRPDSVNQVWQEGPVYGDSPAMHFIYGANLMTMTPLNLMTAAPVNGGGGANSGQVVHGGGHVNSVQPVKIIHGVLNVVGWGILLPVGVTIARYLRVFEWAAPTWFYLHVSCQSTGYIIGVAGWATGIRLGSRSPGVAFPAHRFIGILIFCLATLQMTALLLRPTKEHKYRFYWNVYHHSVGYSVVVLSIVNIFRGFDILKPGHKWKGAYVGIFVALVIVAAVLEVFTWIVVVRRRKEEKLR
ncbi:hypothetical protein M569_11030, partial [Genlisea aurea]